MILHNNFKVIHNMNTYSFEKYDCFKCLNCSNILIIRTEGASKTRCANCQTLINVSDITLQNRLEAIRAYVKNSLIKETPNIYNELVELDKKIKSTYKEYDKIICEQEKLTNKKNYIKDNLDILIENRNKLLYKYENIENSKYKNIILSKEDQLKIEKRRNRFKNIPKSPEIKKIIKK